MKERNSSLDAMKGFAILLVMIGHIINLNKFNDPYLYPMIEAVQMPAFMMISGYISGLKPPIESFKTWRDIVTKRAVTYVLPFFSWLLLKQWDNLIQGFTNALFQLDRGLWFLMTLFILNVLLYTTQLCNKRFYQKSKNASFWGFVLIFSLLSSFFILQYIRGNTFLSPELTIRYIPPFIIGYFMCVYQEQLKRLISDRIMKLGAIVCLILFVGLTQLFHPVTQSILLLLFAIIKGIVGSLVIFYVFLKSKENVIKFKLAWIGTYSLEIYTVHFHFATKLNQGTLSFGLYSLQGFLFVVASFLLMSVMSAGLIYMIKQTRWTNLLLFGRK